MRERIKQMGKLWYTLIFGVIGYGLAFALAITAAGFLDDYPHRWGFTIGKLVLLSVFAGCFHGVRTWSDFRDPVPFPPIYPPPK